METLEKTQVDTQKIDQIETEKKIEVKIEGDLDVWDLTHRYNVKPTEIFRLVSRRYNSCYLQIDVVEDIKTYVRSIAKIIVKCSIEKDNTALLEFTAAFKKAIEKIYIYPLNAVIKKYDKKGYIGVYNDISKEILETIRDAANTIANIKKIDYNIHLYRIDTYNLAYLIVFD